VCYCTVIIFCLVSTSVTRVALWCLLQVPEDTSKDIKGQTEECLKCIDALLAQVGFDTMQ
jgi:enamine deaminase RidA (YjgF/YER057c/UK114 family)